jgi:hypothetical protein
MKPLQFFLSFSSDEPEEQEEMSMSSIFRLAGTLMATSLVMVT